MQTIEIRLNGETIQLPQNCTAQQLVDMLDLSEQRIAMEVNQEILPRSLYAQHQFSGGEVVEVVRAIGGGAN
ncbi:MAG: sulfur carrier protein ThiS [Gammaproteobacteria bacterium]|nr:sulfur carrier protein ThiS [Gammaproteobacteria bacterium]MDH5727939.1 sulfur carrier protein ThiS [Gammaproteobacteria bacterium]